MISPLIALIVFLLIIGLVLYLIETRNWLDPTIRQIIHVVVVIVVILYLLRFFAVV